MKDIKCPKCGTVFQVDESEYAAIAAQVRTAEFDKELDRRMADARKQWEATAEAERLKSEKKYDDKIAEKSNALNDLRNEITRLTGIIQNNEAATKAELAQLSAEKDKALTEAVADKDKEIQLMASKLGEKDNEIKIRILEENNRHQEELHVRIAEIESLKSKLENEALAAKDRENQLKDTHRQQLQSKQEEIEQLRDFKSRLSTKMVGETLEQHCQILFEQAQSMGLFADAYFNKDNTVVDGSKGDFIFRDYVDGNEYVSIMFEMKNEMDTTATKHRNEDFLEKLHKDRQRKNCEYAVLVSMLEKENELYNNGIVDKSHRYPKMIVIRPQFFMPVIRLISEAAKKGYLERKHLLTELETARSQSLDFTRFEEKIDKFRDNFSKSITAAHKKFEAATKGIDSTIEALEKQIKALREIKANFEASEQKLLKANEYADENLTVKKLTHGLPGIRKRIEEARTGEE